MVNVYVIQCGFQERGDAGKIPEVCDSISGQVTQNSLICVSVKKNKF